MQLPWGTISFRFSALFVPPAPQAPRGAQPAQCACTPASDAKACGCPLLEGKDSTVLIHCMSSFAVLLPLGFAELKSSAVIGIVQVMRQAIG